MGMSSSQARMLSLTARLSDLELAAQSISNAKIRLADESEAASRHYSEALDNQKLTAFAGIDNNSNRTYIDATAYNLTTFGAISSTNIKQRFIKDQSGRVLVMNNIGEAYDTAINDGTGIAGFLAAVNAILGPVEAGSEEAREKYYRNVFNEIADCGYNPVGDDNMQDSEWLQAQIEAGNLILVMFNDQAYDEEHFEDTGELGDFVEVSWTSGDSSIQEKDDKTALARAEAEYETTMASIQSKDKRFDLQLKEIDTEHNAIQTEMESVNKIITKNIERSFKTFSA